MEYEIDDRLPVNQYGSLRNVQLSASGELWPALLEKAMAAMFGGELLVDGMPRIPRACPWLPQASCLPSSSYLSCHLPLSCYLRPAYLPPI